jgi:hypothetical protein
MIRSKKMDKIKIGKIKVGRINSIGNYIYIIIAVALVLIAIIFDCIRVYGTQEEVTFTVSEKSVKKYDNDDKYLVFTEEGEVFQVTDELLLLHFNASDLYGQLKDGGTYTVVVCSWRIPLFSKYRNIIEIKEKKE